MKSTHWTDDHITMTHVGTFMAWNEVGLLLDTFDTREDAKNALIEYDKHLNITRIIKREV